jgi:hypothetical protein
MRSDASPDPASFRLEPASFSSTSFEPGSPLLLAATAAISRPSWRRCLVARSLHGAGETSARAGLVQVETTASASSARTRDETGGKRPPGGPMRDKELFFVIPTYRLRDVGETVEEYDEHFWRNGHSVQMIVFDDSSPANRDKYYSRLEQTKTHNDLFYVGPREKEQFLSYLN